MESQEYISIEMFCKEYSVETSFVFTLHNFGLIEIEQQNEQHLLSMSQLAEVEKIMRLQNDLQINTEGIDVVLHLLQKIKLLQADINFLRSRLSLYENAKW
jgi:chaperone modulatory protein CbpM